MIVTSVIVWWLLLQLFGLAGLPLAFRLLGRLPDRGYALARPLGLLLSGYILWLGASLGFMRNGVGGTLLAMVVVLAVGLWLHLRRRRDDQVSMLSWLRRHIRYLLTVELLFGVALVGWAIYKSYNPNLETAGGEKWMEIAFINAVLRSDGFPPQDPWLSGFGISYYYFGYVLMAMVTRLSGLPSAVAFNLLVPTLFALTLTGAFSVVYNMVCVHSGRAEDRQASAEAAEAAGTKADCVPWTGIVYGLLGAALVGVVGNLEGLLEVFHSRGLFSPAFWQWLDIKDINQPPVPGGWIPSRFIWWWRASRVIHDCSFQGLLTGNCNPPGGDWEVIDEFPFFSFLLGDVHPHVLALPFVVLAIALALNQLLQAHQARGFKSHLPRPGLQSSDAVSASGYLRWLRDVTSLFSDLVVSAFGGWLQFVVVAVCLGALGFLNTWDYPIYLFVVVLAFALGRARAGSSAWLGEAVAVGLGLGLLGGVLYMPFYLGFQSQAGGILPNLFNATRLQQFLVFFGPFLGIIVAYLVVLSSVALPGIWRRRLPAALVLTVGAPVLAMSAVSIALMVSPSARSWAEGLLHNPELRAILGDVTLAGVVGMAVRLRLSHPWTFLFLGGVLAWVLLFWPMKAAKEGEPLAAPRLATTDLFALAMIGVGVLLPLVVEFVYLRDNFGIRMNTVFKFYFQAWVLLALAAAYGAYYVSHRLRGWGAGAWRLALVLLVAGGLVYPALAIPNKAANFQGDPTLDGMAWIEAVHPDDYAAIRWLQANATDGVVVLEAPGDRFAAYQYVGRVSALTGLPTLLGWGNHEHQWRGNYDEPARREPDIQMLYEGLDAQQTGELLDKYHITYVYVGHLERQRYSPRGLAKFGLLMDVAYNQGEVTIYQHR